MKTWMILAAAVALAPSFVRAESDLPKLTLLSLIDDGARAKLIQDMDASRTALLPQTEPLPQVTLRYQPRLNDLKTVAKAAKTPAEFTKVKKDFTDWKTAVLHDLYADHSDVSHPGETFPVFSARKAVEVNFVAALQQQFAAQRVAVETRDLQAASRASGDAAWAKLFDNQSPFAAANWPAAADGAVKAETPKGAARYKKIRDIAVRSWGADAKIVDAAIAESMRQNVDPALVLAVIWQESRFNPKATSSCGARGLMQVMPDTGAGMGYSAASLYTVQGSLEAGIKYLKNATRQLKLNLDLSDIAEAPAGKIKALLASYNAGCGAVSSWIRKQGPNLYRIPYAETRHYVRVIADKLSSLVEA